jgi:hypothetical protein
VSITRVAEALGPLVRSDLPVNERLPYFMFSLDIDDDLVTGNRPLDEVHMYIGNPGSTVSSGIAYALTRESTTLENFYFFFDAQNQLDDAAAKICCSARFDATQLDVNQVLRPELRDCHTICVANKRNSDTAYFSGVNVRQLLVFLEWLAYPPATVEFVAQNLHRLDHLLYDVGFDYTSEGDGLRILKSGYYGVF